MPITGRKSKGLHVTPWGRIKARVLLLKASLKQIRSNESWEKSYKVCSITRITKKILTFSNSDRCIRLGNSELKDERAGLWLSNNLVIRLA